jgi:hypothetical protein
MTKDRGKLFSFIVIFHYINYITIFMSAKYVQHVHVQLLGNDKKVITTNYT